MATLNNDLLRRLQSTIQSWGDEVAGAHAQLSDQIHSTRSQLETLAKLLAPEGAGTDGASATNGNGHHAAMEELEAARREMASLAEEAEALRGEVMALRRRETQHGASNQSLTRELAELRPALERRDFERELDARRISELESAIIRREADVEEAYGECETLRSRLGHLENELDAVRASGVLTAEVLSDTESTLTELQEEYDVLQRESEDQASELREARQALEALRTDMQTGIARRIDVEQETILDGVLLDADEDLAAESELDDLMSRMTELQRMKDMLSEELQTVRRESAASLVALGDLREELRGVAAERDAHIAEKELLASDVSVLKSKLEQAELHWSREKELLEADLADAVRTSEAHEARLSQALRDLARSEEDASARAHAMQTRLDALESRDGSIDANAQSALESLTLENSDLVRELAKTQEQMSIAEAAIRSAELERADLEGDVKTRRIELERLQAEWSEERKSLEEQLAASQRGSSAEVKAVRAEMDRIVTAVQDVHADRDRIEAECVSLRQELAALRRAESAPVASTAGAEAIASERDHLREELDRALTEIASLRERVETLTATVRRKEVALQAMEESLATETQQGKSLITNKTEALREAANETLLLRGQLERQNAETERLREELETARAALGAAESKGESLAIEARAASQDASMASQALHVNRTELEKLRRELRETDQQRAAFRMEASELAQRLERERTTRVKQEAELRALQSEAQERALSLRQKQREFDEYVAAQGKHQDKSQEALLRELSEVKARAASEVESMRNQVTELQSLAMSFKEELASRPAETKTVEHAAAAMSSDAYDVGLPDRIADMELEMLAREQEILELNEQIAERDKALETFHRDFEAMLASTEELAAEVIDGDPLSFGERTELAALRQALEAKDAEVQALRTIAESPHGDGEAFERIEISAYDADGNRRAIGEILVSAHFITSADLESALQEQKDSNRAPIGRILVEKGLIREDVVAQVVAKQLGLEYVNLSQAGIDKGAARMIPAEYASSHMLVATGLSELDLTVAMANPLDERVLRELADSTERRIQPVVATSADISSAISQVYGRDGD